MSIPTIPHPSRSELQTLLPSPTYASLRPESFPFRSWIVKRSEMIWQGCSRSSRPLMTGTVAHREEGSFARHRNGPIRRSVLNACAPECVPRRSHQITTGRMPVRGTAKSDGTVRTPSRSRGGSSPPSRVERLDWRHRPRHPLHRSDCKPPPSSRFVSAVHRPRARWRRIDRRLVCPAAAVRIAPGSTARKVNDRIPPTRSRRQNLYPPHLYREPRPGWASLVDARGLWIP